MDPSFGPSAFASSGDAPASASRVHSEFAVAACCSGLFTSGSPDLLGSWFSDAEHKDSSSGVEEQAFIDALARSLQRSLRLGPDLSSPFLADPDGTSL
jgi:hypothetical protein